MTMGKQVKRLSVIFLTLCVALLSGCWDVREVDLLYVVTGFGLDAVDGSDNMELAIQIGHVGETDSMQKGGSNAPLVISAIKPTLYESITLLRENSTHSLFLKHNKLILIGRSLAEKGIEPILDYFMRENDMRMEVWIMVTDDSAKSLLNSELETDQAPSITVTNMMDQIYSGRKKPESRLLDFYSSLISNESCAVLPIIRTVKEQETESLVHDTLAVFHKEKMVGVLDSEETRGLILSTENTEVGGVYAKTERGQCDAKVTDSHAIMEPVLYADGRVAVKINVKTRLSVGALSGYKGYTNETLEPALEEDLRREEERLIRKCFDKAQSLNADVYSISSALYRKYGNQARNVIDNWESVFPGIELELTVTAEVENNGRITLPITEEDAD